MNGKILFFEKIYRYPEIWHNRHITEFFVTNVLKKSAFYIRNLNNDITMLLIPKVQNNASTS